MFKLRKSDDRGGADHGWLKTKHTFSFADYFDSQHKHFRVLRVINEDWVLPGQGFGTHPHQNMEIITYVISGALEHKDSMGNGSVIRAGDVQYMSAGSGVTHSEFNHSKKELVHLLQIWIFPNQSGLPPQYAQKTVAPTEKQGCWRLIVSADGHENSIAIRQDANIFARIFAEGEKATYALQKNRGVWVQVVRGQVAIGETLVADGDGLAVEEESEIPFQATAETELLLFDLS